MVNNFNFIAPFYDELAKLIFGGAILKSQTYFLSEIAETDTVLIIGGGTGKLLEELPICSEIHYVDLSAGMIARAKRRKNKTLVDFIQADFIYQDFQSNYDVIICPFFLDCFDEPNLNKVLSKILELLKKGGKLIVADFQKTHDNGFLIKLMHFFFRNFAFLQSKNLKNIHEKTLLQGFKLCSEQFFRQNMIFSRVYGNL